MKPSTGQHLLRRLAGAATAIVILAGASAAFAQPPVARYTGVAVDMLSTSPGAGTVPVTIVVTRWSTDAERDALLTALLEKNGKAMLATLEGQPRVGSIAAPGSVGIELKYASRTRNLDGTERIMLITDRPMSVWERRDAGRTTDYPFTVVELRMQAAGNGEGKISAAAQIGIDRPTRTMVLENYADQPIALRSVERMK